MYEQRGDIMRSCLEILKELQQIVNLYEFNAEDKAEINEHIKRLVDLLWNV